jgi:hypothetical protein
VQQGSGSDDRDVIPRFGDWSRILFLVTLMLLNSRRVVGEGRSGRLSDILLGAASWCCW